MKTTLITKAFKPQYLVVAVVLGLSPLYSSESLEPMAATGGVLRDAQRRVLGEVPKKEVGKDADKLLEQRVKERRKVTEQKVLGVISSVKVFGARDFAEKENIGPQIEAELKGDRPRTVGDVQKAIEKVRGALMKKGFFLLRIVPLEKNAYDATTKTFSVVVDTGTFGKINVKHNGEAEEGTWFTSRQILSRFKNIKEGEVFDYTKLRSALFDANTHPDLIIDTAIDVKKSEEGEGNDRRYVRSADMNLDVHESIPFHALWEVNNYGMESINEWQTSLTAQYLNLTKHDDVLTISPGMSFGAEMFTFAASYLMPHEWWLGGNTTLYGGYSDLDAKDIVAQLDLEGIGYFVGLQHSENLYNTERHQLAFSAGLLWRYIEDQYTAMGYRLNERGASILPVTAALSYTGKQPDALGGRNFATFQGIYNVMNGGDDLDELWTGSDENYWIARCQLARLQPIFGWYDQKTEQDLHQWILFLKLEGQYTSETLIPVEKLSLGGYNCLRGYRTHGYMGDYGFYGTFELRTPILVDAFASLFGDRREHTPIDRIQFLTFCDYGIANYNDLPSGYDDNEFLCSFGVGGRVAVTKHSQLRCDLAFPIADGNNNDHDYEFYLGFQLQF